MHITIKSKQTGILKNLKFKKEVGISYKINIKVREKLRPTS